MDQHGMINAIETLASALVHGTPGSPQDHVAVCVEDVLDCAGEWIDAAVAVDRAFEAFTFAVTPLAQANALAQLSNAMHSLKTWIPGYDYETGTSEWERQQE